MPRPSRSLSVLLLVLAGCAAEPPPVPEPGTIEARLRRGLVSVSADESPGYALDWQPPAVAIPEGGREAALAVTDQALHEGRLYEDAEAAIPIQLALLRCDPGDVQVRAGLAHAIEALWTEGERRLAAVEHEDAALGPLREIAAVARYIAPEAPQTLDLLVRLDAADRLLALTEHGENELAAGRLGEDGLGALTAFREVLRNRPGDARAQRGVLAVGRVLLQRADAAAAGDGFATAERTLAHAARILPVASGEVADVRRRIALRREARVSALYAEGLRSLVTPNAHGALRDAQASLDALRNLAIEDDRRVARLQSRLELAARYGLHKPGQRIRDPLPGGGFGPELVVVPYGEFRMGAAPDEEDASKAEMPQHTVRFRRGFAIARTEITVGQYARFVSATGYRTRAERRGHSFVYDERSGNFVLRDGIHWRQDYAGRTAAPGLPVLHVTVGDADAYAEWLGAQSGRHYRLPHEAEFEYALRAGRETRFAWGDGSPPPRRGNYTGKRDRSPSGRRWGNGFAGYGDGYWGPAPAGHFRANRFGLHDMDGNVSEWTMDCWHQGFRRAPADGGAWYNPGCRSRGVRGGSWSSAPAQVRAAWRMPQAHDVANARTGFRLVGEI